MMIRAASLRLGGVGCRGIALELGVAQPTAKRLLDEAVIRGMLPSGLPPVRHGRPSRAEAARRHVETPRAVKAPSAPAAKPVVVPTSRHYTSGIAPPPLARLMAGR